MYIHSYIFVFMYMDYLLFFIFFSFLYRRCLHSSFAPSKSLLTWHKQEIRSHCRRSDGISNVCIPIPIHNIISRPPHPFVGFSRVFLTRTAPAPPRSAVSAGSRDRGKPSEDGEKIYYYDNIKPAVHPSVYPCSTHCLTGTAPNTFSIA